MQVARRGPAIHLEFGGRYDRTENVQAQPTQRRKTTRTGRPRPNSSFLSRSSGARSPIFGTSATGTGGGGGENHGATVMGRAFIDIHAGQPPPFGFSSAESSLLEPLLFFLVSDEPPPLKSKLLLLSPTFLSAILVVRLDSMTTMAVIRSRKEASGCGER